MTRLEHVRQMAFYNAWMNARLYAAAATVSAADLARDRGAFFGSILGTLNHLVVGDTLWWKRFALHPGAGPALDPFRSASAPASLDQILFDDFAVLRAHRETLDRAISDWADALAEPDLDHVLVYRNVKGVEAARPFFALVMHAFNHQTHHRGQTGTLLSQLGVDVGVTDLLALIPETAR